MPSRYCDTTVFPMSANLRSSKIKKSADNDKEVGKGFLFTAGVKLNPSLYFHFIGPCATFVSHKSVGGGGHTAFVIP